MQKAEVKDWVARCQFPGPEGGFMAKIIDYDQEAKDILRADHAAADPDYALVTRPEHFQMARALVGTLRNYSTRLKLNKAIIDFSLPNEFVRMLLRPQRACWPHRQWGLGTATNTRSRRSSAGSSTLPSRRSWRPDLRPSSGTWHPGSL